MNAKMFPTAILNAGTQDEVVEFTNKAATFLHDHSPFKGKPAISKLNAVTRAAVWLGGIMKKSYGMSPLRFFRLPSRNVVT